MEVSTYFEQLGRLTDRLWKEVHYDEDHFPQIAVQALGEHTPHGNVEAFDILRWVQETEDLPLQFDISASFGQPPVTVFRSDRFHIDVNFWMEATTSIHEHAFAGAFSVLEGSSLHSHFRFDTRFAFNRQLKLGRLELQEARLCEPGHTQPIYPGRELIHSLFHLEHPSVTVVVRTNTPWHMPQFDYWWPFIAALSEDRLTDHLRRKRQTVELLARQEHPGLHQLLMETLPSCDPTTMLSVMDVARSWYAGRPAEMKELLKVLSATQPRLVRAMIPAFRYRSASGEIIHLRSLFTEPDLRYLLAVLLNFHRPADVLEMMAKRYPDRDPMEATLDAVARLDGGGADPESEENALGFELTPPRRAVLRAMLEGLDRQGVLERIATDDSLPEKDRRPEAVNAYFDQLRTSPPLVIVFFGLK